MNPEMHTDLAPLAILALIVLVAFAVQTYVLRPRSPRRPDAPRETTWRNRWH
jgi:hypothetical protein